jgi:enoyl-[acyl-carrier-protein] reductase (NADH)
MAQELSQRRILVAQINAGQVRTEAAAAQSGATHTMAVHAGLSAILGLNLTVKELAAILGLCGCRCGCIALVAGLISGPPMAM